MKLRTLATVAVAIGSLAVPAGAAAGKKPTKEKVTVMTRNVYLGADLNPAIGAPDIATAIDGAGQIYNEIERTNFPERAVPLAKEIKKADPDLIGLQEVALWRQQIPSDLGAPPINPNGTPATDVKYDFLASLTDEMDKLELKYDVVAVQEEFDAELPADIDGNNATGGPVSGEDLDARLTMRDVVLAKKGTKTKRIKSAHYDARYEADVSEIKVPADRGWISIKARTGKTGYFTFVNTHLEAFGDPTIREAQAKELTKAALKGKGQIVLVGDLNSGLKKPHKITGDDQLAFKALDKFGMEDRGAVQSCCYPSALDDPGFKFDHTVDHVLVKPAIKSKKAYVTGDQSKEMTPSGLWPSDHGGVVSTLVLKK